MYFMNVWKCVCGHLQAEVVYGGQRNNRCEAVVGPHDWTWVFTLGCMYHHSLSYLTGPVFLNVFYFYFTLPLIFVFNFFILLLLILSYFFDTFFHIWLYWILVFYTVHCDCHGSPETFLSDKPPLPLNLIFWLTEFNYGCLLENEWGVIHPEHGNLSLTEPLEKMTLPLQHSSIVHSPSAWGVVSWVPSLMHEEMVTGPILCSSLL